MKKPYYPFCVQIEFVQGCNRDCKFCGTAGMEKKFCFAEEQTIRHSAQLLKNFNYKGRILLAGHGEPTLHPNIERLVAILRCELPKAHISLFTNGVGIFKHPKLLNSLFACGVNSIMFDEYSDNRIEKKVFNLPEIEKYNVEKLQKGTALFNPKKKKRILIAPPIDDVEDKMMSRKLCNHCGAGMPPLKTPYAKKCSIIFRDFFIRWDGNIAICCNDFRGEYFVCNINDCNTFEEAYYNPRLEAARKRLMQNDRNFTPCNVCNVIPLRAGLLPDKMGKTKMPQPTEEDILLTQRRYMPLSKIKKREWEFE